MMGAAILEPSSTYLSRRVMPRIVIGGVIGTTIDVLRLTLVMPLAIECGSDPEHIPGLRFIILQVCRGLHLGEILGEKSICGSIPLMSGKPLFMLLGCRIIF